ncbi:hypothetical protein EMCRGX_G027862 [Ephydatia muelleri]
MTIGPRLAQVHTYPVGTWNSSESASKCFATHQNGTHLSIGQLVHTYPVGTWNSSESASKCIATHKNGTHLHWYTPTLWVHGTAKNVPQSALQLTRMAPISIGQLVHTYPVGTWNSSESAPKCFATHKNGTHLHCVPNPRVTLGPWLAQVHTYPVGTWNSSESAPKCFATHKNGTHFHWSACTHLPCGYMEQLRVCLIVLCNSQEWHPSPLVSLYTPTLWVHGTAQSLPQSVLQLTRMAPISIGQLVHTYPVGTWNSFRVCPKVPCNSQEWHPSSLVSLYTPTLWVHGTAQSLPQSVLQLTRMAPISIGQLVHTYPVGTWNSSESASKYFATHKNGTHLHWYTPTLWVHGTAQSLPQSALQLTRMAPISIGQLVHTYPVGTWNSSESAPKCFATHKNGTHLHWYTTTLWVHGTAQSLPQSDLQLTRMAPISIGQLVHTYPVGTWNSSESAPKCFATHKNGTHLHWYTPTLWVHGTAQSLPQSVLQLTRMAPISIGQLVHTYPVGTWNSSESALQLTRMAPISIGQLVHTYPVGTWNSSESAPKCLATHKNGTHLHWYTPTLWVHGTAQSLPQSTLQLTRMAPISTGQLVHTYPVGTWNSSESAPKCFATHKNGTHNHSLSLLWSTSSVPPVRWVPGWAVHTYPVGHGTVRVCLKVLCNSQEWHPSPLVSLYTPTLWVHGTAKNVPQSALQLTRMAPISIGQLVHTYPVGTWNSSESAPKCFATHKNGTHLHCVPNPRVTLGPWLAQVHTYPVGTWNSSESAPKCFATHKNGTHFHWSACTHLPCGYMEQLRVCLIVLCNSQEWHPSPLVSLYTPTLWVHGTAQSLPQSVLQLTRMAPISICQLVHTYPVGTWNSFRVCPKVPCNSQEWHPSSLVSLYTPTLWVHGTAQSLPQSVLQLTRMAPISIGQLVHTYPVGTWNSSESASKYFATHKNGTHLHWYTPTLWVHGTAQSLPQSALQLTRMAPISIGQLVHTYPVGTWNSSESAPKCFATHKNGTHLHWSACTQLPCGYMEQLRVCPKVICNSQEWHPSPLVSLYTPTLWVHGTAQSLPQSALQLTRMAPISIGQLVHTYPVGTWNSSESAPKCFATHKNGTHLHWYTPTLWVQGTAQSLPQSALQLTRMAPISIGQLVHIYPVGTWNSSESAPKCFATHKNGTHLHCVPNPRVTLGPRLAQVHTYPVDTWNSSESAPKCFATHKNGTHLHWSACTHLPCGYMQQLRVCPKVLCNSQEWHPSPLVSFVLDPRVTLGPQLAQVHTYPVGTWNSSESASKSFATHENGTHLHWYTPTLWVHATAQSLPQSALQLTRMAPISIGQLVHTYPVGTWNSSESASKSFATHENGTHLHW